MVLSMLCVMIAMMIIFSLAENLPVISDNPRNYFAAYSSGGSYLLDWDPDANDIVHTIYSDDYGVYLGGEFTFIEGY